MREKEPINQCLSHEMSFDGFSYMVAFHTLYEAGRLGVEAQVEAKVRV